MIHTKVGQDFFQSVHYHSLFFTRTLLASNVKNNHTNAQLPSISTLGSCQDNSLQKSYNLRFDFVHQHMEKSNPRTSSQHLLFFSPPFFLFFLLIFFLFFPQIFFRFFLTYHTLKASNFLPKI